MNHMTEEKVTLARWLFASRS